MLEDCGRKVCVMKKSAPGFIANRLQHALLREALYMAEQGKSSAEIVELLDRTAMDASIYIAVDTLEYLKTGGRVTPAGAALASILNLKPVLQIQGDKLDAYAKVRGEKAAQEKMLQAVEKDINTRSYWN